ncbi:MAG: metalloregulator ArsR/SmtB family transcription factor [Clostridiaceae bacterium]|nr:metalloregulator ArsR/SmtB family transcription factor [Clostridia bacterium]MDY3871421.1 metalloregulator ArsR/SmtB family transcription factor [Clostridiaceae bacterium]
MSPFSKNAENPPVCQQEHRHPEHIEAVRRLMPDDDSLYDLSEVFRVFGDSTRIRILYALFESELCVCDLATLLGLTQSAVSHQLRILKDAKLVKFRREGKSIFYALDDDHVRAILSLGMEHLSE